MGGARSGSLKLYALYDTKNGGICVGVFEGGEAVAEYTGNTLGSVYAAVSNDRKLRARYEIVKIEEDDNE